MISDSLDPKWVQSIEVDYFFEEQQIFLLKVYDVDEGDNLQNLNKHDFLGQYEFMLSTVAGSRDSCVTANLQGV